MSKYVIELRPDCKVVQQICESDGQVSIGSQSIVYLEELNADYVNEHFGILQDDAYNAGFERGKAIYEKGCEGCAHEGKNKINQPCVLCCNAFKNQWTAKSDKIEVGDEVNWMGDCFIVTRIFQPRNMKEQCDGIDNDGCVYHDVLMDDLEKTGRHSDIMKILEEMQT